MEAKHPLPFIPKPATGAGTGQRTGRWFRLSDVLRWLEDPAAYWSSVKRPKAS